MASRPGRPGIVSGLIALVAFCILIGLGGWQVQRLKWKTDLLHRIAALQTAPSEPIDAVLRRVQDHVDINFTRVQVDCPGLQTTPMLRLYAVYQGRFGYRMITVCPLSSGPFGSVLVDRGFVAQTGSAPPAPPPTGGPVLEPVVGVLRTPDRKSFAAAPNQPAQNLWYWRDLPAMASALHASRPAPVFMMLQSPAPPDMIPRPVPVPIDIPNNHLGYAITWFGLAAALAGVYLAMLFGRRLD